MARWPIEPGADGMTLTALKRIAKVDLPSLLDEAGAVLLCLPDDLWWRLEGGELVASGPAERRPTATEIHQNRQRAQQTAAAMEAAQTKENAA